MPRIARVVMPGIPHHVTQRGNRREEVFLADADRTRYLSLLHHYSARHGLRIWAYCLMPNHVHFVAVPTTEASLGLAFRDTHQAYATWLNRKTGQNGHLWQGRFFSCALDEGHLWAALRYVERNPVHAGLVRNAWEYAWSSAVAHCGLREDPLLSPVEMPWPVADWHEYLRGEDEQATAAIRRQTMTGRPCGGDSFVRSLELALGRDLRPAKRGPKPKQVAE